MLKRLSIGAQRMGCVLALLVVTKEYAYIDWLGDSRVYMFRNGKEVYRTEDHSMINEMARSIPLQRIILESIHLLSQDLSWEKITLS